jgi:hypothetical protein
MNFFGFAWVFNKWLRWVKGLPKLQKSLRNP